MIKKLFQNPDSLIQKVITGLFAFLFFTTPLLLTAVNYELFEFNKMLFVYAMTNLILFFWAIRMILKGALITKRSPFDIVLLLLLISYFISTVISIDPYMSIWGYYGRFNGGLVSLLCYISLYFAFTSNVSKQYIKLIITTTLLSAVVIALYGVLQHFGIDEHLWVQDVKNRVFSTLGQPNWLAAYLLTLIPISLSSGYVLLVNKTVSKKSVVLFVIYMFISLLFFVIILYTKSRSAFFAFWVILFMYFLTTLLFSFVKKIHFKKMCILVTVTALMYITATLISSWPLRTFPYSQSAVASAYAVEPINPSTPSAMLITDSFDIRKVVWKGAVQASLARPIFGWGPDTFAWVYYQFRPMEHNLTSEWDFLYNKAHNEYLNYAVTIGFAGLFFYMLFLGAVVMWFVLILKQNTSSLSHSTIFLLTGLFFGWFSLLITHFFGFSVVVTNLYLFLLPAVMVVIFQDSQSANNSEKLTILSKVSSIIVKPFNRLLHRSEKINLKQIILISLSTILMLYTLFSIMSYWMADVYFLKGKNAYSSGDYQQAVTNFEKAINLRPYELFYLSELSESLGLNAITNYSENVDELNKQLERSLSLSNDVLTRSPYSVSYWKTRVRLLYVLSQLNPDYYNEALESIQTAQKLAPTDAKIAYNIAVILEAKGDTNGAIEQLKKTIEMKPNYKETVYTLAALYEKQKDQKTAKEWFQYILTFIDPGDVEIKKKLESL